MTLLQFYLFANVYILISWLFYRYFLKDLILFQSIRIYLNAALLLSLLLPLVQSGISSLLSSTSFLYNSNIQELPALGIIYHYEEALDPATSSAVNWPYMLGGLLVLGGFITALLYLVNHFRIKTIIRKSEELFVPGIHLRVVKSDEVNVPFIYNKTVVLPASILPEEIPIILHHESLHYKHGHRYDNLLFSLCHILFWVNPFYLLLKASLKLNHEYQVDGQILSSGADPTFYKLSLVKYSVGSQKFSLANGMSSRKIKSRLLMINANQLRRGKWRFCLLLPMIILSLALFSLACVQKDEVGEHSDLPTNDLPANESPADSVHMKIIEVTKDNLDELKKNEGIVVLMNRSSRIYVAGEKDVLPEDVEGKIIAEYNRLLLSSSDIRIVVQKDVDADPKAYQKLLDNIAMALYKLRMAQSEDAQLAEAIPFEIYNLLPDKNMGRRN